MPLPTVSEAEVEQFKLVKAAEKDFVNKLSALVVDLRAKVGPLNPVVASMTRFLKARV